MCVSTIKTKYQFFTIFLVIFFILKTGISFGQCDEYNYYWISGSGYWTTPENWQYQEWDDVLQQCVPVSGVPGSANSANITNNGTAIVDSGVNVQDVLISNSTLQINSGTFLSENFILATNGGSIDQIGGTLSTGWLDIGDGGNGSLLLRGGTVFITNNLRLAMSSGITGTCELSGGQINAHYESIGQFGSGAFLHTDGSNHCSVITVGEHLGSSATYELTGSTAELHTTGFLNVAHEGEGHFAQSSGTVDVGETLVVGGEYGSLGSYDLSGNGQVRTGQNLIVGSKSSGTFTQTGGVVDVGDTLNIAGMPGGIGSYHLSGDGQVRTTINLLVGCMGDGEFSQTGGNINIGEHLNIGIEPGSSGSFVLDDGHLQTGGASVGFKSLGNFVQNGGTATINGFLVIGHLNGGNGTYVMNGGILTAQGVYIGEQGEGSFLMNGGTINGASENSALNVDGTLGTLNGQGSFNIIVEYKKDLNADREIIVRFEKNCLTAGGELTVAELLPKAFAGNQVKTLLPSSVFDISFDGSYCGEFTLSLPYDESDIVALGGNETQIVILRETTSSYEVIDDCRIDTGRNIISADVENFGKFAVAAIKAKIVKLKTVHDVAIRDVTDIIWQEDLLDDNPNINCNIADYEGFDLELYLEVSPFDSEWNISTDAEWSIQGGTGTCEDDQPFAGIGPHVLNITSPRNVGIYTLKLDFSISINNTLITEQPEIEKTLYVILRDPIAIPNEVNPPKEKWLEKACGWAAGACDDYSASLILVNSIYFGSGWYYRDPSYPVTVVDLLEGRADHGNCYNFAKVWDGLARVLGVGGTDTAETKGSKNDGFVTIKDLRALDGLTGNAHTIGSSPDRWCFGAHCMGQRLGKFYDPTFRKINLTKDACIEWHGLTPWFYDVTCNNKLRQNLTEPHFVYEEDDTPPWGLYSYDSCPQSLMFLFKEESANFTGNYSAIPYDSDADGRFNNMFVVVEVNALLPVNLRVTGSLYSGETFITRRPTAYSSMCTSFRTTGQTGFIAAELNFSGGDIGQSGLNGPYTINLDLIDSSGSVIDEISFDTPFYTASQFSETSADILDANDIAVDTDANSLFDLVHAAVDVNVFKVGNYFLDGVITKDNQIVIASADVNAILALGRQTLNLLFDGKEINKIRDINSYDLHLVLSCESSGFQDNAVYKTKTYDSSTFERKDILISGPYVDSGIDTNGNLRFDYLTITAGLDVKIPAHYSVTAWLQDTDGNDITSAKTDANLAQGMQNVTFNFDGVAIRMHEVDGPYNIIYMLVSDNNDVAVDSAEKVYTTTYEYKFYDFDMCLEADIFGDCQVDFKDFAVLAYFWLQDNPIADIVPMTGDGIVDEHDLALLAENWLNGTDP